MPRIAARPTANGGGLAAGLQRRENDVAPVAGDMRQRASDAPILGVVEDLVDEQDGLIHTGLAELEAKMLRFKYGGMDSSRHQTGVCSQFANQVARLASS